MPIALQETTYEVRGKHYTGYLADGSKGKRVPGILVVHEGSGLSRHTKDRARMLADLGYVAFAGDYFGDSMKSIEQAYAFVGAYVSEPALLREHNNRALDVLRKHASVDPTRLAAIGFCFGGHAVLELARSGSDARCVVGFHPGLGMGKTAPTDKIAAKVLICVGDRDPYVPAAARDAFVAEMAAAKVDTQVLLMIGVEHSFTNPDAGTANVKGAKYDAVADRRSWNAMRALFAEALDRA